jgi:hypothetical protein
MDDQLLFEHFHEVFEIEPRAGSFDRLRSVLIRNDRQARVSRRFRLGLPRLGIRLAAVLALVLLAVASAGAFIAIHQYANRSVLVHPAPFKVQSPGSAVCFSGCQLGQVTFVSASVGFVLESKAVTPVTCAAVCPPSPILPVSLFRTTDGGTHWRELTTSIIDCCQARLIASASGNQLLLYGSSNNSTVLLFSGDAGVNWTRHGLPAAAGQAVETGCKGGHCASSTISPLVYFIDPSDGWVLSQEQSFNIADLYRTTNAGADWTLAGKIDLNKQFGLDLANGTPLGNGIVEHGLTGQFVFSTGSLAWFVPQPSCVSDLGSTGWGRNRVFRSTDGGLNWTATELASPTGLAGSALVVASVNFFDASQGVLELVVSPRSCDPQSGYTVVEHRFVYTTADGGTTWSTPISVPQPSLYAEMRYIDPQHWFGWPAGGGWISTSDAGQHWTVVQTAAQFGDRPAAGQGLPPQLPDNYPLNDQFGFVDSAHGWALLYQTSGDANARGVALYLTNDAGLTWRPANLPELA